MNGKIDVKLLWQTLESMIVCRDYDRCDECKAYFGIQESFYEETCPRSSVMHVKNIKIAADAIKEHLLDHLPYETEVPLEEVIDLLKAMS